MLLLQQKNDKANIFDFYFWLQQYQNNLYTTTESGSNLYAIFPYRNLEIKPWKGIYEAFLVVFSIYTNL